MEGSHPCLTLLNAHAPAAGDCDCPSCRSCSGWSRLSLLPPERTPVHPTPPAHPAPTANDRRPKASPNRLRICRLMYKPLPDGSCKSELRQHRNRRLALVKKRAIRLVQTFAARRAIPHYFQKRTKHNTTTLPVKKSASPSPHGADGAIDKVSTNCTVFLAAEGEQRELVRVKEEKRIVPPGEECKVLAVADRKAPPIDRADTLSTIKEYYSIQRSIRLLLAMLQERMEEVETMQKKSIMDAPAEGERVEEETDSTVPPVDSSFESNDGSTLTEDDATAACDSSTTKPEATGTPDTSAGDIELDKENSVPADSTLETISSAAVALNRANSTPVKDEAREDTARPYSFLETSKSDILDPAYTCDIELEPLEQRKNRSIVDSLLNKFNLSPPAKASVPCPLSDNSQDGLVEGRRSLRDRTKIAARPRYIEIPEEPRKMRVSKVFGKLHKTLNIDLDCTNSNSSTEFYGFDEGEVVKLDKPSLPGLLPTPIVKKSQPFAPFLAYGSTMEADTVDAGAEARSDLFREEGLISFGSLPPRLECPQRPIDMVRPRTVAQKRILVQRENDVRYLMIDNEAKIFQFLKKRSKNIDAALDFCRMKELQDQQIPFTRDTWRALAWLRTEKGRYYFQAMNIDNRSIKLSGCRGNHRHKTISRHPFYSSPVVASRGHRYHYVSNCHCPPFPEGVTLNVAPKAEVRSDAVLRLDGDNSRYLYRSSSDDTGHHSKRSYPGTKPGPLSSKCLQPTPDDDPTLGRLEVFKMPPVELEVFPKLNRPLDGFVQPYLKMILPHDGITENWARFAVSTLKTEDAEEAAAAAAASGLDEKKERSFVFELPYLNNQRRILIRRRFLACPGLPVHCDVEQFEKLMEEKLTFRAAIDSALADGRKDELDPDELVCADVLSELTDSVAIALAEDVFVKDDPEVDYVKRESNACPSREQMTMPLKIETPPVTEAGGGVKAASPSPAARSDGVASVGGDTTAAAVECSKTVDPVKLKLLREMKRLNATIIEGPSEPVIDSSDSARQQHPPQKRCDPQYCSMGCICEVRFSTQPSAMASMQRKQHCKKMDCIFGCQCGYEEKRVSLEQELKNDLAHMTDNENTPLSSADVKYLREKATARLAKEEREFTHTVILIKNTTVLVQNKECESRRQKKKPKKYDDYYNDVTMSTLLNGGNPKDVSDYISKPPPNVKPLSSADRMRHAHVLLNRLPQMAEIEPLCMVHDLYRCFCEGKATQGKPFSFTEENCVSPGKTYVQSGDNATLVVMPATAGRMMKVSQNGATAQEVEQPIYYDTASTASVRKRLYSFERAHNETLDPSTSSNANDGDGKYFKDVVSQRKRRDSSEDSYKPPSDRKAVKKKLHTSFDEKSAASVRARRASMAPGHVFARSASARRPSVAVGASSPSAVARKGASSATRRASMANSTPKEANVFKSPVKTETSANDAQYTVVKQKKASGVSGISNIIIKRIPTQTPNFEPMVKKPSSGAPSKSVAKKSTQTGGKGKATGAPGGEIPVKYMSVRTLKQLMLAEYRHSPDVMEAPLPAPSAGEPSKPAFVNVLLLDSEENIDNEPQLNILCEGSKKLVINGNRRSFIDNSAFREGMPPARTMPFPNRTTYIVQILSASSVQEVESMFIKKPSQATAYEPMLASPRPVSPESSSATDVPDENEPQDQQLPGGINAYQQTDQQLGKLMHHINDLLRRKTIHINPAKKGIMHICRWGQLLKAYALGEIDILDLTLTSGLEMTVVATAPFKHPLVPNVKHQLSARRLTIDKMVAAERPSLLMKMVVCQVENVKTNELALVLYGNDHFWHFCGFLKVSEKSLKNDSNIPKVPSKHANARVKAKIHMYQSKKLPRGSTQPTSSAAARQVMLHKQQQQSIGSSSSTATSTTTTTTIASNSSISSEPVPSPKMLSTQSNIDIMPKAVQPVHFPLGLLPGVIDSANGTTDCRWMRLKIENDFSHMYLPTWQCCVTYARIKKAIYDANRTSTPIRLENPAPSGQNANCTQQRPFMYALPKEGHALFLGPYKSTETKIDVILCQSVRGSLYEREVYEKQHGIQMPANTKRTVGWWVDVILSRVATVKDKARLMGAKNTAAEVAKASTSAGGTKNNAQRSLLKRNNLPPVATVVSTEKVSAVASDSNDTDDDVVLVESDEDNERLLAEEQHKSTTSDEPPTTRRELSVEKIGMDLFRLVEGTMKENQQEKRKIEKVLNQERFTHVVTVEPSRKEVIRKRPSSPLPPVVVNSAPAAKVIRLSDTGTIEKVSVLQPQQQVVQQQQQQQQPSVRVPPSSTMVRNSFTRISLPSPQTVRVGSNGVVTKSINGLSTLTIAPMHPPESSTVPVRVVQNAPPPLRAVRPPTIVPSARLLNTTQAVFTSGSLELGGVAGVVTPRQRLNSVAVERIVTRPPPPPVMHKSDNEDDDDVVWLDDDDTTDNTTQVVPSSAPPSAERTTNSSATVAATAGTSNGNGLVTYGHKTILSQEQIAMIARKVDLTKTGQQDGYSFNPASGLLKMKRSLLNSIKNDVQLGEGSTLSSSEKPCTVVSTTSAGVKLGGGVVISAVNSTVAPSASTITLNGNPVIVGTGTKLAVPASATSLNGKPGLVVTNSTNSVASQSIAVPPSTVSKTVNATSPPSATITMPRTKVVPRVTAATARYGEAPARSDGVTASTGVTSSGSGSAANVMDNLKYLSEAQEEKLLSEQPHTRGVLESIISGLGLVEVVRLEREVIIHMKELTVKKQLVSVKNLEAAVTLLNQFIQRNTYAFRPHNLSIQWNFKERSLPLRQEERITSVINQQSIVTVYGIINLSKPEQVQPLETKLPKLYEDLMMMKLAMQCYNKQQYEEEKCYENDEKIYKRALEIIKSVNAKSKWLQQQRENLLKQRRLNRDKERQLKGRDSSTADAKEAPVKNSPTKKAPTKSAPAKNVAARNAPSKNAPAKDKQESVIVIDDD